MADNRKRRRRFLGRSADKNMDDAAFMEAVFQEYVENMFFTAKRYLGNDAEAEDAVQDAFLKLIPKVSILREFDCCRLRSYIASTIRNTSITKAMKLKAEKDCYAEKALESKLEQEAQMDDTPENQTIKKERSQAFADVIQRLDETDRFLLVAKYEFEMTNAEIAEQLHVQPNSVRMMLTRARRNAMEQLKSEGDFDGFNS